MLVAPIMVDVTKGRDLTQAMASCVGVSPCFSATPTYADTASRARDLLKRSMYPVGKAA